VILTVIIKQKRYQFLLVAKATALEQLSKFYPQIQRTGTSNHSQWPVIFMLKLPENRDEKRYML